MELNTDVRKQIAARFTNELWPLNKSGNPELAVSEVIHAIEDEVMFSTGMSVTFDIILAKYKEYLKYIKAVNAERQLQYHTKTEDISTFVIKKRYNEDFIPSTVHEIDRYLYGD